MTNAGHLAWRFLSGHTWHGRKMTDATWFRKGSEPIKAHERPLRWSYLPRAVRALIRTGTFVLAGVLTWAWYFHPLVFWLSLSAVVAFMLITVAVDLLEKRAARTIDKVPARVTFSSIRKELEFTDGGSPLLGLGMGGVPVRLDLDGDAPHVALSMGTGAGKSSVLRGIIAQGLRAGWEHVTIIDPKYVSLNEFRNDPRVTICRTWPEQWEAIMEFQNMMDDRYKLLNEDETLTFPRRVLIMEEGNSWAQEMGMYWRDVFKGKGVPPVIRSIAFVVFKGRQVNCNVIGAWQRLSVGAVGSGDARDQFGTKVLARFSQQAWNSLVGTNPRPRSSRHPGRCFVVTGESQTVVQLAYWSPGEAVKYSEGIPTGTDEPPKDTHVPVNASPGETPVDMSKPDTDTPVPTRDFPVTLQESIDLGIVNDLALPGLRTARARPGFPKPIGKQGQHLTYSSADMVEWESTRQKRTQRSIPNEASED